MAMQNGSTTTASRDQTPSGTIALDLGIIGFAAIAFILLAFLA